MSDKKCLDTIAVGQLTGTGHYTKYGGGDRGGQKFKHETLKKVS